MFDLVVLCWILPDLKKRKQKPVTSVTSVLVHEFIFMFSAVPMKPINLHIHIQNIHSVTSQEIV